MTAARNPPAKKSTSFVQLFDVPVLVYTETVFDFVQLALCRDSAQGLDPAVEALQKIYDSLERVFWHKSRCCKLCTKAMSLVFIICDHHDINCSERRALQTAVEQTIDVIYCFQRDVQEWADLVFWRTWYSRHEIAQKLDLHEKKLKEVTEGLYLATIPQIHTRVSELQESLKNSPAGAVDRKRAQEQLYRLRSLPPGKLSDLAPPELTGECVRLAIQHNGARNDVWKGRWLDRQDVALICWKECDKGTRDHNGTQQFEKQVKTWRELDHPFVLRLYGWCKFEGETYLVCPWMQNGNVTRYLEGKRDRHRRSIHLILEIVRGLDYLHNKKIIHGFFYPSNILINDDGRAILSDFSLVQPPVISANSTQANQVNVIRYQSPEVISGEARSEASDVYSWAMTALDIITGKSPFYNWTSPGELMSHIKENGIPTRSDYKSPVLDKYPAVWELFVKCWSREPTDRPTAMMVVEVIEKIPGIE